MLSKKERRWLGHIRLATDGGGMYPGEHWDFIPNRVRHSLWRKGFIQSFTPHNPVHKERATITPAGRQALQESDHEG